MNNFYQKELELKEYYKSNLLVNTKIYDFIDYIVKKYEVDLEKEFELFNYVTLEKQEEIQKTCKHQYVEITNCPLVKGNFEHKNHNKKECKTCNILKCYNCNKIFKCTSCYTYALDEKKYNNYQLDWKSKYITLEKYEDIECKTCNRKFQQPIWFSDF